MLRLIEVWQMQRAVCFVCEALRRLSVLCCSHAPVLTLFCQDPMQQTGSPRLHRRQWLQFPIIALSSVQMAGPQVKTAQCVVKKVKGQTQRSEVILQKRSKIAQRPAPARTPKNAGVGHQQQQGIAERSTGCCTFLVWGPVIVGSSGTQSVWGVGVM